MEYTKGEEKLFKEIVEILFCYDAWNYGIEDMAKDILKIPMVKAAPDLYEACKMLVEHMTMPKGELGRPYLADVKRQAEKALAKAERGKT